MIIKYLVKDIIQYEADFTVKYAALQRKSSSNLKGGSGRIIKKELMLLFYILVLLLQSYF